jgi:hypothetical protein
MLLSPRRKHEESTRTENGRKHKESQAATNAHIARQASKQEGYPHHTEDQTPGYSHGGLHSDEQGKRQGQDEEDDEKGQAIAAQEISMLHGDSFLAMIRCAAGAPVRGVLGALFTMNTT